MLLVFTFTQFKILRHIVNEDIVSVKKPNALDYEDEVEKKLEDDKLYVAVEGRLDTITSPDLEKEINESIEGVKELTIDFEKVEYISSSGLRVLLAEQKVMNKQGSMKLINVNDTIMEIFEVTGFTDILTIE